VNFCNEKLHNLYTANIIMTIILRKIRWRAFSTKAAGTKELSALNLKERGHLGNRWEDNGSSRNRQ
jgi:hypothetical protein